MRRRLSAGSSLLLCQWETFLLDLARACPGAWLRPCCSRAVAGRSERGPPSWDRACCGEDGSQFVTTGGSGPAALCWCGQAHWNARSEGPATGGRCTGPRGRCEGATWCAGAALRVGGGSRARLGRGRWGLQLAGSPGPGAGHGRGAVVAGRRASGLQQRAGSTPAPHSGHPC